MHLKILLLSAKALADGGGLGVAFGVAFGMAFGRDGALERFGSVSSWHFGLPQRLG